MTRAGGMAAWGRMNSDSQVVEMEKAFPVPPLSNASRRDPGSVGGLHIVPPILLVSHKVQKLPMCVLEKIKRKEKKNFYPPTADSEEEFYLD